MYVRRTSILSLLAMLLLGVSSAHAADGKAVQSKTVDHVAGKPVEILNAVGDVEVRHTPGDKVRVRAEIVAENAVRAKQVKVLARRDEAGVLSVGIEWPDGERKALERSSLRIEIPDLSRLEVRTENGGIKVEGLGGEADLRSMNGAIDVRGFKGPVSFDFRNGDADLREIDGRVEGKGVNGGAKLSKVSGSVRIETTNGEVEIALTPAANGPVEVKTSNGGITLSVGKAFGGTVMAKASNGKVDIDLGELVESKVEERDGIEIKLVNPGEDSSLRATNGVIRLRRVD